MASDAACKSFVEALNSRALAVMGVDFKNPASACKATQARMDALIRVNHRLASADSRGFFCHRPSDNAG